MPSRPPSRIATTKTLSRQYQAGLPLVTPPSGTGRLQKVKQHLSFNLNKADCLNITWTHESLCCSNKGFAQGTIDTLKNCEKEIEDKCSKAVTGWVPLWGNISPTCVCNCTTYFLYGKIYLQPICNCTHHTCIQEHNLDPQFRNATKLAELEACFKVADDFKTSKQFFHFWRL